MKVFIQTVQADSDESSCDNGEGEVHAEAAAPRQCIAPACGPVDRTSSSESPVPVVAVTTGEEVAGMDPGQVADEDI